MVYSHGDLIHAHCGADATAAGTLVEELLRVDPARWFCEPCLAKRLRLDGALLARALLALRVRGRAHAGASVCSACSELRPSYRLLRAPA